MAPISTELIRLSKKAKRWFIQRAVKDKTTLREVTEDWVEITTPHLDRHNDYLQIFVKKTDGGYLLCDDGYIIQDLLNSGCKLDSPKRQELLRITLSGFGVSNAEGVLQIKAHPENFALRKHSLLQAMLAVNDLFYLSAPMVSSLFYEDVVAWMDLVDIRYTPRVKFTGKSGYDHLFDFVIPKSREHPERVVQTISRPSRESAESAAFKWIDIKEVRSDDAIAYAFLNDNVGSVNQDVVAALKSYEMTPVLWSERETMRQRLRS